MVFRSCLTDPTVLIVADASVVINLTATGHSEAILDALPNRLLVVEEVLIELENRRQNRRNDTDALSELVAQNRIEIVRLGEVALQHFGKLVGGHASETLDDGEAATVGYAVEHDATVLIDERKANRICGERFSKLQIGCTVDLFVHPTVQASLGREKLANAVFNALYYGRMRVLPHHAEWAVELIGIDRAAQCDSLPRSLRQAQRVGHRGGG